MEAFVFRTRRLPRMGLRGLALGIAGMGVLLWPKIVSGTRMGRLELVGVAILVIACMSWALGSILSRRIIWRIDILTAAALQMTFAGIVNTLIALVTGGFHKVVWTQRGAWAIAYLVIGGSWIGFTAYIWLLEHVPTPKVATYAYVNPIVAIYFGLLILKEKVDVYMLVGTVIIVAAVGLVNSSKLKSLKPALVECEKSPQLSAVSGD